MARKKKNEKNDNPSTEKLVESPEIKTKSIDEWIETLGVSETKEGMIKIPNTQPLPEAIGLQFIDFLRIYKYLLYHGIPPIESKITGVARMFGIKSLNKGDKLHKLARALRGLIIRKGNYYELSPQAQSIMEMITQIRAIKFVPLVLYQKQRLEAGTLYLLKSYYVDPMGKRHPVRLNITSDIIFQDKDGNITDDPLRVADIIGEVRCIWRQCRDKEVLNLDEEDINIMRFPHIPWLFYYVLMNADKLARERKARDIRMLIGLRADKLFPSGEVEKIVIAEPTPGNEIFVWKILSRVDENWYYFCPIDLDNSCSHVKQAKIITEKKEETRKRKRSLT